LKRQDSSSMSMVPENEPVVIGQAPMMDPGKPVIVALSVKIAP